RLSRLRLSVANPATHPDAGGIQRHRRVDAGNRGVRLSFARRLPPRHPPRQARALAGAGPLPRAILGGIRRVRAGPAPVLLRNAYLIQTRSPLPRASGASSKPRLSARLKMPVATVPSAFAGTDHRGCASSGQSKYRSHFPTDRGPEKSSRSKTTGERIRSA